MKNSVFFFLGLFFLVSCSNEPDTNFSKSNVSEQEGNLGFREKSQSKLQILFENMVNSKDYKDLNQSIIAFGDKMNYDGNNADFETKEQFLNWISTNINLTDFADYNEALGAFANIESNFALVKLNHFAFFQELPNAIEGELISIFDPELVEPETGERTCLEKCSDVNQACRKSAAENFEITDGYIWLQAFKFVIALADYQYALEICHSNYLKCYNSCK